MSQVAIIGSGHNALLAAHAVERSGHEPVIFGGAEPAPVQRSMFYAQPIPGVTDSIKPVRISILKRGSRGEYALRLYGDRDHECSWDELPRQIDGYPIRPAYNMLWMMYSREINQITVQMDDLVSLMRSYPVVISTLNASHICINPYHKFRKVDTKVLRIPGTEPAHRLGQMIYNGETVFHKPDGRAVTGTDWFRYSEINGDQVWEYTSELEREGPGISEGVKPISNTCDCWQTEVSDSAIRPRQVHRVGRFAKWQRGVQNHHAFQDTMSILATEGLGRSV